MLIPSALALDKGETHMKYVKMLGLLAVAAAALMAFTGTAFGATATAPTGTSYTSTIKASSEGATSLHGTGTVTCLNSTVEGKIESHGAGVNVGGKVSKLTFTNCGTDHVTVKQAGSLSVTSAGTLFSTGAEISITKTNSPVGHITCVFTTNNTHIGNLTDSHEKAGHATLDLLNSQIPRTGGSFLCGSFGEWTGSYTVTTPAALYID
jgi:hypothetical protein